TVESQRPLGTRRRRCGRAELRPVRAGPRPDRVQERVVPCVAAEQQQLVAGHVVGGLPGNDVDARRVRRAELGPCSAGPGPGVTGSEAGAVEATEEDYLTRRGVVDERGAIPSAGRGGRAEPGPRGAVPGPGVVPVPRPMETGEQDHRLGRGVVGHLLVLPAGGRGAWVQLGPVAAVPGPGL